MHSEPHDYLQMTASMEAEQSIIGALLLDNQAFDEIGDKLVPQDFFNEAHRILYETLTHQLAQGVAVDVVTLSEELDRQKLAERVGGLAYLAEVANNTPSAANIRRYAEIVHSRALLRRLQAATSEISKLAEMPAGRDVAEVIDQAEALIFEVAQDNVRSGSGIVSIRPVLSTVMDRLQELADREDQSAITGMTTSLTDLDSITGGLQDTDLIVVAGRPGMGKTTLAVNMAEHIAIVERKPVAIFTMEMPQTQLAMRMLSSIGRIEHDRLRSGLLTEDEWSQLTYAFGLLHDAPIFIDETPAVTPSMIRTRCRRLTREHGKLGLVVIDYLQLMASDRSARSNQLRSEELSDISRAIKALAKELRCPVVALSQLNRSLEQRPNKRPIPSDLRESGAIEQDADLIAFVYRDEVYNPDSPDRGMAEVIIGKHRNGPLGTVRCAFRGNYSRFENYAPAHSYGSR
jgi:replicative DNA helicase